LVNGMAAVPPAAAAAVAATVAAGAVPAAPSALQLQLRVQAAHAASPRAAARPQVIVILIHLNKYE
jgi:hypothetical protein